MQANVIQIKVTRDKVIFIVGRRRSRGMLHFGRPVVSLRESNDAGEVKQVLEDRANQLHTGLQ